MATSKRSKFASSVPPSRLSSNKNTRGYRRVHSADAPPSVLHRDVPNSPRAIKVLNELLSKDATNRSCVDCRSPLIDTSKIYASFTPDNGVDCDNSSESDSDSDDSDDAIFSPSDTVLTSSRSMRFRTMYTGWNRAQRNLSINSDMSELTSNLLSQASLGSRMNYNSNKFNNGINNKVNNGNKVDITGNNDKISNNNNSNKVNNNNHNKVNNGSKNKINNNNNSSNNKINNSNNKIIINNNKENYNNECFNSKELEEKLSFFKYHEAYAPPNEVPCTTKPHIIRRTSYLQDILDQNYSPLHPTLSHAVFTCEACSLAHKKLPKHITTVKCITDPTWTESELSLMMPPQRQVHAGQNNALSKKIHQQYLPNRWNVKKRPHGGSTTEERVVWCRAVYETLSFVFPDGPLHQRRRSSAMEDSRRWGSIYGREADDADTYHRTDSAKSDDLDIGRFSHGGSNVLPSRLVDFFCVVQSTGELCSSSLVNEKKKANRYGVRNGDADSEVTLNDIYFETRVEDCFPTDQNQYSDMKFPSHIAKFVFPDGCRPRDHKPAPTFFTFALTSENGTKLYGAAMQIYDETLDVHQLGKLMRDSNLYNGRIPSWIPGEDEEVEKEDDYFPMGNYLDDYVICEEDDDIEYDTSSEESGISFDEISRRGSMSSVKSDRAFLPKSNSTKTVNSTASDLIFLPKCLVILSHYGFFELWRTFLQQLYHISLVEAPLPIERYIANFCAEVPLPPRGRIEVKFGFTDATTTSITRPAINRLPLVAFSYRPLFASLSVSNIVVLIGCLLEETRVVLCSKHYGLLGPVAEGLLSLLFPFVWQGIYIPVTPSSLLDVIDAPVPYLIGLHSRYLEEVPLAQRPIGVVFVDLDEDIVHLGYHDEMSNEKKLLGRSTPCLPEKDATKLKSQLDKFGGMAYLVPDSGAKGRMTYGQDQILHNVYREKYAHFLNVDEPSHSGRRKDVLSGIDKAFLDNEHLMPITGFATDVGTLTERDIAKRDSWKVRGMKRQRSRKKSRKANRSLKSAMHLLDMKETDDGFSETEIRNAFLRFFVSIFKHYQKYFNPDPNQSFQKERFLGQMKETESCKQYLSKVLSSQMFEHFIQESRSSPNLPEVRFFNESIIAKSNRSKKNYLANGGKQTTAFLSDQSDLITETYMPPPPSNWGLPDDGRIYHYGSFPKLKEDLFGKVRQPKQWGEFSKQIRRSILSSALLQQQEIMTRLLFSGSISSRNSEVEFIEKDLEWAIHALAYEDGYVADDVSTQQKEMNVQGQPVTIPHHLIHTAKNMILVSRKMQGLHVQNLSRIQNWWRRRMKDTAANPNYRRRMSSCFYPEKVNIADIAKNLILLQRQRKRRQNSILNSARQEISAIRVQCWYRAIWARLSWYRTKRAVIKIQNYQRGRRIRFAYALAREMISKLQACIRGYMTRIKMLRTIQSRRMIYRNQMFLLWTHTKTPLSYRTKFWKLVTKEGFLTFALLENELRQLWNDLAIQFVQPSGNIEETKHICAIDIDYFNSIHLESDGFGNVGAGFSALVYHHYLQVQNMLSSQPENNNTSSNIFPAERNDSKEFKENNKKLQQFSKRLDLERLQIYERLNEMDEDKMGQIYLLLQISNDTKYKKLKVSQRIWERSVDPNNSAKIFFELFPELDEFTNIKVVKPSKKGMKRLGLSKDGTLSIPLPLMDKNMWVESKIDQLIIRNLTIVGNGFISGAQSSNDTNSHKVLPQHSRQWQSIFHHAQNPGTGLMKYELIRNILKI